MIHYYCDVVFYYYFFFIVRGGPNYFNWTGPVKTDVFGCVEKIIL